MQVLVRRLLVVAPHWVLADATSVRCLCSS